ncbi:MAG TPA: hypothetical protein VKP11_02755, partial [Frankiaceae bacterium]|nr:hypothetical protein [Frankiaceae bacterium]
AYTAVGLLVRARMRRAPASTWLDGLLVACAAAGTVVAFVLGPVLAATGGSVAAAATNIAYPVGDLLLVAMSVGVLTVAGRRGRCGCCCRRSACSPSPTACSSSRR